MARSGRDSIPPASTEAPFIFRSSALQQMLQTKASSEELAGGQELSLRLPLQLQPAPWALSAARKNPGTPSPPYGRNWSQRVLSSGSVLTCQEQGSAVSAEEVSDDDCLEFASMEKQGSSASAYGSEPSAEDSPRTGSGKGTSTRASSSSDYGGLPASTRASHLPERVSLTKLSTGENSLPRGLHHEGGFMQTSERQGYAGGAPTQPPSDTTPFGDFAATMPDVTYADGSPTGGTPQRLQAWAVEAACHHPTACNPHFPCKEYDGAGEAKRAGDEDSGRKKLSPGERDTSSEDHSGREEDSGTEKLSAGEGDSTTEDHSGAEEDSGAEELIGGEEDDAADKDGEEEESATEEHRARDDDTTEKQHGIGVGHTTSLPCRAVKAAAHRAEGQQAVARKAEARQAVSKVQRHFEPRRNAKGCGPGACLSAGAPKTILPLGAGLASQQQSTDTCVAPTCLPPGLRLHNASPSGFLSKLRKRRPLSMDLNGAHVRLPDVLQTAMQTRGTPGFTQNYELGRRLGKGGYGAIFECFNKHTGGLFACKLMSKQKLPSHMNFLRARMEYLLQSKLRVHPNVVRMVELFEGKKHFYFIMELCRGGDLFDYLERRGSLDEANAGAIFAQIAAGVQCCHSNRILHRDLKLENLLLPQHPVDVTLPRSRQGPHHLTVPVVKLADFGSAMLLPDDKTTSGRSGGSLMYQAPEVLEGLHYGLEADMWSLGIILFVLLCGVFPFTAPSESLLPGMIRRGAYNLEVPKWAFLSAEAKDIIDWLLQVDPLRRPTADDICAHPWVLKYSQSHS